MILFCSGFLCSGACYEGIVVACGHISEEMQTVICLLLEMWAELRKRGERAV